MPSCGKLSRALLKAAHEGELIADALGWDDGHPRLTAWHLARALRRWEAVTGERGMPVD